MNFLSAELRTDGGNTVLTHSNFNIPLLPQQVALVNGSATREMRMGVRPDALSISTVRPEGPVIEGKIFVTELLGGDMLVDVQLADARIRVKTSTDFAGVADDTCYMTVNRDKWHLFDIEDGHAYF